MSTNTNVEVKRNQNENSANVLRRFQKRVQESGIVPKVRSLRYANRALSTLKVKRGKLIKLDGQKEYDRLKKMGKLTPKKKRS
jgi:ribosomal protein S21